MVKLLLKVFRHEQEHSSREPCRRNFYWLMLIGHHIILDLIIPNNYYPNTVPVTRELLLSARNSHRACTQKLAERKKEEFKNKTSQQLDGISNEILTLNLKKDLLENLIA